MNKQTKKYYQEIYYLFPILGKQEKRYLSYLQQHLQVYELHHQDYQYDDYIRHYGHPEDIVSSYYEHIESEYIIKHMKSRKIIKYTSILLVLIAFIISICFIVMRYRTYQDNKDSEIHYEDSYIIEQQSE